MFESLEAKANTVLFMGSGGRIQGEGSEGERGREEEERRRESKWRNKGQIR